MTNNNRGRLTVNTDGNWRLYSNTLPVNSEAVGTVTRDDTDTGALVLIKSTGLYKQLNAGVIRMLDQRKVKAALGISNNAGAPTMLEGGKRINVYLDARSVAAAVALGSGNVSEGIRMALKIAATANTA